jgi:endogenous inhibitor of DNA gyrase (YacG/DUF329 family)
MARIKVACKKCGNVFDWNDLWPDGLKRCPLCGIPAGNRSQASRRPPPATPANPEPVSPGTMMFF